MLYAADVAHSTYCLACLSIGSRVAPVLCDIFLAECDKGIRKDIEKLGEFTVCRYVDDFLVLAPKSVTVSMDLINDVVDCFNSNSHGLTITHETMTKGRLQFLDLSLNFESEHVCWKYEPRTKKGVLPFNSAQSKLVKRGTASCLMRASLEKSCPHVADESFLTQVNRLKRGGYPDRFLGEVAENLVSKMKKKDDDHIPARKLTRPAVIPYIHNLSHNLKKVAAHFEVPVVFSAPHKLSHLCSKINNEKGEGKVCQKKHAEQCVECATSVVCSMPVGCGGSCVGRAGRCMGEGAGERAWSVGRSPSGGFAVHCGGCPCGPELEGAAVLGRCAGGAAREIHEAFRVGERGEGLCIGAPSRHLTDREFFFLSRHRDRRCW
uniref:Putative reverse transcriptase rna-dependent dna polymerase n=1 Tax=Ixodes ricinus TaxID=34613 RepID=A0A6B0VAU2_IXORI